MEPSLEWPLEESLAGTGLHQVVRHWWERPTPDEPAEAYESFEPALYAPGRWGLAAEAVAHLGDRSISFGCAFVALLRPVHATPARTPTIICVPS